MKRVAIYARVSSKKQKEEKTIDSQLEELRKTCKGQEVSIVEEYVDDGWSGETLVRPGLDKLRTDAKKELFERVYFYDNDRIARNLKHQIVVVEELERNGIEVFIKDRPVKDAPEGKLLFQMLGALAEFERAKILERTRRGRIHKVKEKGILGAPPPYGYKYVKRKDSEGDEHYEINKEEAKIILLIFDLYIKHQSMSQVVKELKERGIKTRKGKEVWSRSTIASILKREAYTGKGYYRKRRSVKPENSSKEYRRRVKSSQVKRDRDEWIPREFPKILGKEKFDYVQKLINRRSKPFGQSKHFYLLSSLVECSHCGAPMTGTATGVNLYYRCNDRTRQAPLPKKCPATTARVDEINPAVWQAIKKAILDPDILVNYFVELAGTIEQEREQKPDKKKRLKRKLESVSIKKERIVGLYAEEKIDEELFDKKMAELKRGAQETKKKLKKLEREASSEITKTEIKKNLRPLCALAEEEMDSLEEQSKKKQRFIRYLVEKVVIDTIEKKAKIILCIPLAFERKREGAFSDSMVGVSSMSSRAHLCGTPGIHLKKERRVGPE